MGVKWPSPKLHYIVASLAMAYQRRTGAIFLKIDTRFLSPKGILIECVRLFQETGNGDRESPYAGDQMQGMFCWVDDSA